MGKLRNFLIGAVAACVLSCGGRPPADSTTGDVVIKSGETTVAYFLGGGDHAPYLWYGFFLVPGVGILEVNMADGTIIDEANTYYESTDCSGQALTLYSHFMYKGRVVRVGTTYYQVTGFAGAVNIQSIKDGSAVCSPTSTSSADAGKLTALTGAAPTDLSSYAPIQLEKQ